MLCKLFEVFIAWLLHNTGIIGYQNVEMIAFYVVNVKHTAISNNEEIATLISGSQKKLLFDECIWFKPENI